MIGFKISLISCRKVHNVKKILLLGGSTQQVIAIRTAKELGYYTILCDYLPDNPGQHEADEFCLVSTTDKEAVLKVAVDREIDGVVAYSSDPAAPTAAYVAEKLGLPGIPYKIAEAFCNKNKFREYLTEKDFNVPKSVAFDENTNENVISCLKYPIIIKPTDSSGSKGVTVIHSIIEFKEAKEKALDISRNGIVIAEEYIERDHPDVIEAEIFVVDGQVTVWGLMNTIRDPYTNPLLPAAYSYPLNISENRVSLVKEEIQKLIYSTGVLYGAFNIEMIISKEDKLYFLDAGPRNGGNELPEFIGQIMKKNLVRATIESAMGKYEYLQGVKLDGFFGGYWGMVVLHTDTEGIFNKIEYDELSKRYLLSETYFIKPGETVKPFMISRDAIGLAMFCFPDREDRDSIVNDFRHDHIKIQLFNSLEKKVIRI